MESDSIFAFQKHPMPSILDVFAVFVLWTIKVYFLFPRVNSAKSCVKKEKNWKKRKKKGDRRKRQKQE